MLITNQLAKWILKLVGGRKGLIIGLAIWPFIFVWPKRYVQDERVIRHERKHLEQWKRYGIVGFVPVYLWYCYRYGYWNNPLEVEARAAEQIESLKN